MKKIIKGKAYDTETANFECSNDFNFFRGMTEKRHMIDLKNLRYIIENESEA